MYEEFLVKSVGQVEIWLKSDKSNTVYTLREDLRYIYDNFRPAENKYKIYGRYTEAREAVGDQSVHSVVPHICDFDAG
jgi:hypothetical protein